MRGLMLWLGLAGAAVAAPNTMTQQGRLLGADGTPIEDEHTLTVRLYAGLTASDATDTFAETVDFSNGYYSVTIGPVDAQDYPTGMWLGVAVDGGAELQRTALSAVPYALEVDRSWNGIRLDGETPQNASISSGAAVADTSAHGGAVRRAGAGDAGRILGFQTPSDRPVFSAVPAKVTVRAKVSDTTSSTSIGDLNCTAQRDGAWVPLGTTGPVAPDQFVAADTWQEFTLYCPWEWSDAAQFVGWDRFADVGAELSIDYIHIVPGASRPGPQRWTFDQSNDLIMSGSTPQPMPGLQGLEFVLDARSSVKISYSMQVHNLHEYTDQHCGVLMYLDGSTTPIQNNGGHGSGFIMPGAINGSDRQKWWDYGVFQETVTLPAGRHSVSMSGIIASGSNRCRYADLYGGGHVIVEALPE